MRHRSKPDETIHAQQIRLLYSQSTTAVVVGGGIALLTAYYFQNEKNAAYITAWAAFLIVVSLSRLTLFRWFSFAEPKDSELNIWLRRHLAASFIGGTSWGVLSLFFDPSWTTGQQAVFLVIIAGIATAAISTYAAVLKAYVLFLIPLLLPLALHLLIVDSPDSDILLLLVLVLGAGLFGVARNFHQNIVNTIRLIVERESLQEVVLNSSHKLQKIKNDLQTTELRFRHVMESSLDGYWEWDITNDNVYFSPRYKEQLGFAENELPNAFSTWESRLHPEDREAILEKLRAYLKQPWGYWEEEFRLRHKNGTYKWILARGVPTLGSDNTPVKLTGVHIDITDRVKAEHKIKFLAYHDWLTKLPNRTLLNDRITHALARSKRTKTQVFILFIDLDRFKHVNDSLGHHAGDQVLKEVAKRFAHEMREEDTMARLSGDEFVVLIENVSEPQNAIVIVEKLLASLRRPFVERDQKFYLTASIGISAFPSDGDDPNTLLKNADAAMYRAKKAGRNTFQFYSEELTNTAFTHIKLDYGLRQALLNNQFQVYYQPKLCLKSGQVLGAEALLRWLHPEEGFISPQDFIPVAEESGLIMEIGEWVLKQACHDARLWKRQGLFFDHVAVNISGIQVQHVEFAESVRKILDTTGFPAESLELEVTENLLMQDARASAKLLDDLRQLGISIAIDDFGTGYSSLAYLTRFPVNKLKIDRSFISKISVDEHNAEISSAIIGLGRSLNMKVVAEGIETEQQLKFLSKEGCDEGQGYLFSKPLPHDEFVAFLKDHASQWSELQQFDLSKPLQPFFQKM